MHSHSLLTGIFIVTAAACPLYALHKFRTRLATDPQFACKCAAATVAVGYSIHSFIAKNHTEQVQHNTIASLLHKYQHEPDAYSDEQLAKRAFQPEHLSHTLRADRDTIQDDLAQLTSVVRNLAPANQRYAEAQQLLKKLQSLHNNLSQAIAPFDLAACHARHEKQFRPLIMGMKNNSLHGQICTHFHDATPYPYLACVKALQAARKELGDYQKHVSNKHDFYLHSAQFCDELQALYHCIIALPRYQEESRQLLHEQKENQLLTLQSKQLKHAATQTKQLETIKEKLDKLIDQHGQEIEISSQHLNKFNLLTAQLFDNKTTPEQKQLALLRLFANSSQDANNALNEMNQQKQELSVMQQLHKKRDENVHASIEQLKSHVKELERSKNNSPAEISSPGANISNNPMTQPSAPPQPNAYPQLEQEGQPH